MKYFLQGLLFIAPAGITIYGAFLLFKYIDGFVVAPIAEYLPVKIPGLGIFLLVVLIALLGFVGQTFFIKPLRIFLDKFMESLPVVKTVYTALKDLLSAFVGQEKKFNKPVLVKVNTISELEKIGFITTEDLSDLGIKDKVSVYFPHSYNFSGEMFIVPVEHVKPLNIPPADAMKFVVSGGVTKV
ncbi:MAG: DUF502 domain-containing protein [Bacteroidales bacterium]|nr:DUF502 domain-containing protein [Bacteroidales bacterium]